MKKIVDKLRIPKQKCFKFLLCFISSVVIFLSVFASVIFVSAVETSPIGLENFYIDIAPYYDVTVPHIVNNVVCPYYVCFTAKTTDKEFVYGVMLSDTPSVQFSYDVNEYLHCTSSTGFHAINYCYYFVNDGRKIRFGNYIQNLSDVSITQSNCTSVEGTDGKSLNLPLSKSDFNVSFTPNNTTKAYDVSITTARTEPYYLSVNAFNKNVDGSKGSVMFSYADFLQEQSEGSEITLTCQQISDYLRYGSKPSSFSGVSDSEFQTLFFKNLYIAMRTYDDNFARYAHDDVITGDFSTVSQTFLFEYSHWKMYTASSYLKSKFNDDFSKNSFFKLTLQNQVNANYRVSEKKVTGNQSFSIPYTYFKTTLGADYIFSVLITDLGSKAQNSKFFWWDFNFKGLGYDGSANPINNPDYTHTPNTPDGVPNGPPNVTNTPPDNDDYGKYTDNGFDTKSFTGSTNSIFDWFKGFLFIFPPEVTAIISLGLVVIVGIGIIRLVVG